MAKKLVRVLRPQHPDYHYLKKVFQHTRELLEVGAAPPPKRLPALLTDAELVAFYEAIWQARQLTHVIMLKLLLFTGMRNAELVQLRLTRCRSADLPTADYAGQRPQGSRMSSFRTSFRGELAQYLARQQAQGATYLFESNRHRPYSTRRLRQIVKQYARAAGIDEAGLSASLPASADHLSHQTRDYQSQTPAAQWAYGRAESCHLSRVSFV